MTKEEKELRKKRHSRLITVIALAVVSVSLINVSLVNASLTVLAAVNTNLEINIFYDTQFLSYQVATLRLPKADLGQAGTEKAVKLLKEGLNHLREAEALSVKSDSVLSEMIEQQKKMRSIEFPIAVVAVFLKIEEFKKITKEVQKELDQSEYYLSEANKLLG
ncbi:MAG: hypothetical protein HYW70_00590 [Candidatus Nealsonbacteria bacterium]|nr:hypothetical protein [Candidatus Nealsonbacteria bacterium]